jgi:hypothetical protein
VPVKQDQFEAPYYVKALAMAIPAMMLGWQISGWIFFLPGAVAGHADFRHLYTAGYMLRTGDSHRLYDPELQRQIQNVIVSPMYELPFNHPAYESLFFVPLSLLPYKSAYFAFLLMNLAAFGAAFAFVLRRLLEDAAVAWKFLPIAICISFIPVGAAFMEGQDSIFLLLFLCLSFASLQRDREFAAGALSGLTVFKFQIALPIAVLFLCWRRWRFVSGFAASSAALAALSLAITGIDEAKIYVDLLLSHRFDAVIPPSKMMNLHGFVYRLAAAHIKPESVALLTALLSVILIAWVVRAGSTLEAETQFPLAILVAAAVSYHMFVYDDAILLIPIALALSGAIQKAEEQAWILALCGLLFVLPFFGSLAFLFVIPLCLLPVYFLSHRPKTRPPLLTLMAFYV